MTVRIVKFMITVFLHEDSELMADILSKVWLHVSTIMSQLNVSILSTCLCFLKKAICKPNVIKPLARESSYQYLWKCSKTLIPFFPFEGKRGNKVHFFSSRRTEPVWLICLLVERLPYFIWARMNHFSGTGLELFLHTLQCYWTTKMCTKVYGRMCVVQRIKFSMHVLQCGLISFRASLPNTARKPSNEWQITREPKPTSRGCFTHQYFFGQIN